ncbi:MAG: hypothetical protein Pg6C_20340 [Treponemataceae bacterium]|nr:MAG: hypothetical protein Pg6C_20340 [Treponemataceae bacterium]
MTTLEEQVKDNLYEIGGGIAWVLVGKFKHPITKRRRWHLAILWEDDFESDSDVIKKMLADDPNAIFFNSYNSAWVGFDECGNFEEGENVRTVAKRIRNAYQIGRCKADYENIEAVLTRGAA